MCLVETHLQTEPDVNGYRDSHRNTTANRQNGHIRGILRQKGPASARGKTASDNHTTLTGGVRLQLVEETVERLASVTLPVIPVAIAGKYRTGKSYLMNRLAGVQGKHILSIFNPSYSLHWHLLLLLSRLSRPDNAAENMFVSYRKRLITAEITTLWTRYLE